MTKPIQFTVARDDADLKLAARELRDAHAMLLEAHHVEEPRARREAMKTATAKLALASRAIDVVVIRRGGICGDCLPEGDTMTVQATEPTEPDEHDDERQRWRTEPDPAAQTSPTEDARSLGFHCDDDGSRCDTEGCELGG